ncbi:hypothetical protein C0J52_02336 [Blattella germanica]|nr:hypothetical protein C0J52_02336 [Blattella germanica]
MTFTRPRMSTLTPKSNNMLKGFIDDTPACTPIPQASSTATHRPGVSPPANMHYNDDAKTDLFLDGAIDGMKSIISKIQDAKLQLNECEKLSSARKESNISQGSRNPASEVNSSLGILKLDDLQGFSEYEFSNKMLFDENEEIRNTKIVDPELSDLAIDMRLRLQKELAQRAIHKAELLNSGVIDHVQPDALRNMESLGKLTQNPKVSLDGCSDIDTESQDISDYSSDEIENRIVNMSGLNLDGSLISEHETTSNFENFHNPFDSKNLDNETKLNMAAIIAEFSHEDFVPGEKCEGKLLADESVWKKENIPPTLGAISSPSLNLDFSGIVGNAEISLIPDKSVKDHKRKISVGEFFRLKSNVNASFGMPAKSPQKNHKLRPLAEVDESLHNTSANSKRTSVTNSKRDRSLRTEEESFARDSLSLSRIADILAQVDTCASPRTVVSNILKQSGLYGSKTKECGAQRDSVASSHSFSVANISKMVSLKDHSNFTDQDKERLSINSSTEIKFPMNKSCASSQLSASENKSRNIFSNSTIKQSSKKVSNEDSKLKQRKGTSLEDDWLFTLPSANEGVGAKLHSSIMKHETETARREDSNLHSSIKSQRNYLSKSLNNSDRSIDRLTAVAESIASGDFDVLKLETVGANLDKSILDVTRGLCDLPRDSVDCSALVPVLYKEHPQLLRQEMSAANTIDCDSSINWSSLNCSTSTETSKSLDLKRETSFKLPEKVTTYQAVSNAKWVTIKIPTPVPYICVGVPEEIVLPIQNITDHWILCGIELISINLSSNEINENDQPALVHLPSKKVLMDPNNSKDAKIEITNASGKSDLDFKTIPEECAQEIALKCYNSDENTRLVQLSGVLSIELVGIIPVELETINLAGSVGKAGLGIHKASLPLKIVVSE